MVIIKFILILLVILSFLYTFWIRLRDDYLVENVFTTSFYGLWGGLLGYIIARNFLPMWWFWIVLTALCVGIGIGFRKFRFRFFETYEAIVAGSLVPFSFIYLYDYILNRGFPSAFLFFGLIVLMFLFLYLDNQYKKFTWYKSGKVGFTGLSISGLFFILRAVIATFNPTMISLVGKTDIIISSILALVSVLALLKLSKQT